MALADLPLFIVKELSGPYGPTMTDKINQIIKWYNIYSKGAEFEMEKVVEEYTPSKFRSRRIKRLIDKQAEFMVGKPPDIKVSCPQEEETENGKPNESDMQEYLNTVLKKNIWSDKLFKGAKDCFIGSRVLLKANVSEERITIAFIPADGFYYETAFDDVDVLDKVILFYCTKDSEDKKEQRWWRQSYWMESDRCFVNESYYDGYGRIVEDLGDKDTRLDRIPCYVIVNDGLSGDLDGESDVATIMEEDSWYNKMRSSNLDSLRKTMNPIKWISGATPNSMKSLVNIPGAVWELISDPMANGKIPAVGTIEHNFAYSDVYGDTLGNIQQSMNDILGIPDVALENTKGLVTSGKGLKALYWPLICRCESKWATWKPALEWLAELVIYSAAVFPKLKNMYGKFEEAEHVLTVDNQYPLPEDEEEERKLDLQEVGISRSIRSYLMEWGGPNHKGLTKDQADAEIDQMIREQQMFEHEKWE